MKSLTNVQLAALLLVLSLAIPAQLRGDEAKKEETKVEEKKTEEIKTDTKSDESSGSSETYGKREGVLGPVTVGPFITALGFPSPFRFGVESKYQNQFGLSADYGFFPSLTFSNVGVKYNSWRVAAKWYPFSRALFVGVGFGKQNFTGTYTSTISGTAVTQNLDINTTIVLPHVGWRWVCESGLFFGMELGVQIAASSSATYSDNAPGAAVTGSADYAKQKKDIEDKGKTFGQNSLPHFALLQVGWLF